MDLWAVAQLFRKHWVIFAGCLLLTAAVSAGLEWQLPASYTSSATLLLLPPIGGGALNLAPPASVGGSTPASPGVASSPAPPRSTRIANPYLSFDSSVYVLARVVVQVLAGTDGRSAIKGTGALSSYDVTTSYDEPVITVVVTDPDSQMAVKTRDAVVAAAMAEMTDRQRATGVPSDTWVTATPITMSKVPVKTTAKLRTVGIAAGLGVAVAIAMVFFVESISRRRLLFRRRPEAAVRFPYESATDLKIRQPAKSGSGSRD